MLYPNKVNVNPSIYSFYVRHIVPRITRQATLTLSALKRAKGVKGDDEYEDDGNYGSAATIDVEVLQAISKRVHYGTPSSISCLFQQIIELMRYLQASLSLNLNSSKTLPPSSLIS